MNTNLSRRRVLRGTMGGMAITVGLPYLDCFLNSNGDALAATGEPLPVCFGTWLQSMGLTPGFWVPKTTGPNYENNDHYESVGGLKVLEPYKDRINIFSGMKYFLDGRAHRTHTTGPQIATTGGIPRGNISAPSIDSLIADQIGTKTRFRSLEVCMSGSDMSWSRRSGSSRNPSEGSPSKLYTRIFGPDFQDPNTTDFTPDSAVMARRSVLSSVGDQRKSILNRLGAADRARLDEYFTALREIEQQLALELQEPAPLDACRVPEQPDEAKPTAVVDDAARNAKLFAGLLTYALACGQTRIFNVTVDSEAMRQAGSPMTWHIYSHEEPVDETLGYQKETTWFIHWTNMVLIDFLQTLDGVREGSGSVLDRLVVLWQTDHQDAKTHSLHDIPVMTIGNASGRLKTGIHVAVPSDPVTRVGLTVQQALGVPVASWGEYSNETSKTITEILA